MAVYGPVTGGRTVRRLCHVERLAVVPSLRQRHSKPPSQYPTLLTRLRSVHTLGKRRDVAVLGLDSVDATNDDAAEGTKQAVYQSLAAGREVKQGVITPPIVPTTSHPPATSPSQQSQSVKERTDPTDQPLINRNTQCPSSPNPPGSRKVFAGKGIPMHPLGLARSGQPSRVRPVHAPGQAPSQAGPGQARSSQARPGKPSQTRPGQMPSQVRRGQAMSGLHASTSCMPDPVTHATTALQHCALCAAALDLLLPPCEHSVALTPVLISPGTASLASPPPTRPLRRRAATTYPTTTPSASAPAHHRTSTPVST